MSDYVMSIVNEVIYQKNTKNPVSSDVHKVPQEPERPNYQRQNTRKRLMVYEVRPEQAKELPARSDTVSELLMKGMGAGEGTSHNRPMVTAASILSDTLDKSFFSFLLDKNSNLQRLTGFVYTHQEAACIGMQEHSNISQLFAVDRILHQFPALDFTVKWSVNREEAFEFRAVGSLERMKAIETVMNKNCVSEKGIRLVQQPTQYLQKTLNYSADTIAAVEGVPYTKLLPQLLEYYTEHPESMLECRMLGSYLLLGGQHPEVEAVMNRFRI